MSTKDDRDNRSNQLNPNNDAYHSSRSGGSSRDDDDSYTPTRSRPVVGQNWLRFEQLISARVEWTVVSLDGRVAAAGADLQARESALAQNRIAHCEDVAIEGLSVLQSLASHLWKCEIAYAEATMNGERLPAGREYLATVSSGWGKPATRLTPADWPRMARTVAYREQARAAQKLLIAVFAPALKRIDERLNDRPSNQERPLLWNLAQTTRAALKTPERLSRSNVESLLAGLVALNCFGELAPNLSDMLRLARINEVLVSASNHRAPMSSRLTFDERSDAYTEFFDKCIGKEDLTRLATWFAGGEKAVAAVKSAFDGSGPKPRRDELGTIDIGLGSRLSLYEPFREIFRS